MPSFNSDDLRDAADALDKLTEMYRENNATVTLSGPTLEISDKTIGTIDWYDADGVGRCELRIER